MKIFTLKSLLLILAIVGGVNAAWAAKGDVTTNADIDFSNAITGTKPYTIEGTVGKMTWNNQWTLAPYITDGILYFGNFDGGVVELVDNNIGAKDVVTISFDLAFGKLSGKHVGFTFKDTEGNGILTQWFDAYNGDFDDSNPLGLNWSSMYRGNNTVIQERCVYFTIELDYAKSLITTKTKCYMSGTGKAATEATYTASMPSTSPIGAFVLEGNINNTGRYSTFDNLKITTTEGDYSAATAGYTVNWVCDGEIVKTDDTRSGDVDGSITLLASDKVNFMDGETKYIYVSDDAAEQTIAEDGSTVVTITVREGVKYAYTVTSSYDGNTLDWTSTGSVWEDENMVKVHYPRYQAYETTLVGRAPVNNNLTTNITVTEDGFTTDLEYTSEGIDDLYLLSEAENLETGLSTNATTYTDRVSNSLIVFGSSGTLLTLPAGKYVFTLGAIGGDNNTHQVQYVVKAGEETIIEGACTGNFLTNLTSEEFTLNGRTEITFTCSDPASGRGIDLVYVRKTGDVASIPVTVTAAGYATLCSEVALDFTNVEGLDAYVAKMDGSTVKFTKVEAVPAGTGLLLKGEGDFEVPVVASADEVAENLLVGVVEDTEIANETEEGNTNFVLMNGANGAGFYKVSADGFTVRAGSAYLSVAMNGEAKTFIGFDGGTATAIKSLENADAADDAPAYNVAGQRVNGQYKGIVVRNGHKIVMK